MIEIGVDILELVAKVQDKDRVIVVQELVTGLTSDGHIDSIRESVNDPVCDDCPPTLIPVTLTPEEWGIVVSAVSAAFTLAPRDSPRSKAEVLGKLKSQVDREPS